jgi:flagellar basal body-associated protein FliL
MPGGEDMGWIGILLIVLLVLLLLGGFGYARR